MFPSVFQGRNNEYFAVIHCFVRTRMHPSATRNNPTKKLTQASQVAHVSLNLLYEISRNQIRKEYSLEFSFTEM